MVELTDFLLARIAEDEERAKDALSMAGLVDEYGSWHPQRVLAECQVKRALLRQDCNGWRRAQRLMAAVYADHPDYVDGWTVA